MKIAVTGASGHIGSCICHQLIDRGHDLKVLLHERVSGIDGLPVQRIYGGVLNRSSVHELVEDSEAVVHLAAVVSIKSKSRTMKRVNAEGTRVVLEAALQHNVRRFIHFSTIHTYRVDPLDQPLNEAREPVSSSPYDYDLSKIQAEALVRDAAKKGLETIILHPTAVMGPFDYRPSVLGKAIIRFYNGENPALIPGGYDWVDVRDVADAAINALRTGTPGHQYILSGHWVSVRDLAEQIAAMGGAPKPSFTSPYWLAKLGIPFLNLAATLRRTEPIYTRLSLETVRKSHKMISSAKAAKELGYTRRPFSETLGDTISWFRSRQMIV